MPELSFRLLINAFLVMGAIFALWKGGRAERTAAAIVIANVTITEIGHSLGPTAEDIVQLINDGLTALALLAVTLRYGAPWMGGIMLFFAAQFAMHSYYLVMDRPHDYLHALINNINWSGITWCLIIGTAVGWRQRLREARSSALAASA